MLTDACAWPWPLPMLVLGRIMREPARPSAQFPRLACRCNNLANTHTSMQCALPILEIGCGHCNMPCPCLCLAGVPWPRGLCLSSLNLPSHSCLGLLCCPFFSLLCHKVGRAVRSIQPVDAKRPHMLALRLLGEDHHVCQHRWNFYGVVRLRANGFRNIRVCKELARCD
ncbi:hypothetical protein DUNSADRAFT_11558 [Dunaliella salina]|uniref:Encoded protein n=1 Tax=Dunaliella salina TaxID=3046 RepID=A0ABQ7GD34_DUNSA|nr:hypothetical protein DUNSADRAFT_11558 [Dunaliella salina]|eukprot:KAF5832520.1 hypothetical protein DUNSADRAFT_11558 [Dunaliella salina]